MSLVFVIAASLWAGLALRRWTWERTAPVRFQGDIRNGFNWGSRACDAGYLNLYDDLLARKGTEGEFGLDYTPLRLGVMTAWVAWQREAFPGITAWENDYAHTWPLLWFNTACGLAAAAGAFALVHHVLRGRGPWQRIVLALAAALALWFNPAVIWNAHAWPQWDLWCVPFFLWALWYARLDRWLLAGALIAVGAMFKGQVLIVAPVLLLWPLSQGRWGAVLRLVTGAALGTAVAVSPWLIRTGPAAAWLGLLTVSGGALLGLLARAWRLPRSVHGTLRAVGFTAALWLTALVHQASFAWYHVGFAYPTRNHKGLIMGPASNLAGLLRNRYGWSPRDVVELPWTAWQPTLRTLLIACYAVPLLLCAVQAGRLERRADPRWLLAAVGPWVFMFTLMPQMHERYLLWGAACSAVWVALGVGPTLLHLGVTALAWIMMATPMLGHDRSWAPGWFDALDRTHPDKAWALFVLAAALVLLTLARPPTKRV